MGVAMSYGEKFRIKPNRKLRLDAIDPAYKGRHETEESAAAETERYGRRMAKLQTLLYAERKHSVLVVLQALDAGGKDGTINHVFRALNAQGVRVVSFKQPTSAELAHDFLWRVHLHAPARGEIVIFNRSHYEDVLVTRVHKLIDEETWTRRYRRIRQFESQLADNDTLILKFFLHISKEEQLARFARRLEDPQRNWKISEQDYAERDRWDDYISAFEDAIAATSAKRAPWFVIPANHKWFRNLAVSEIIVEAMEALGMSYPEPAVDLAAIRRKYHAALREERAEAKPGKNRRKLAAG
ncbi:MAG TPA: polyphosphate kinase 2 family protein [Dongiaceae bacterium]|nr:polyphosphate kinase 2 family protein [Dongiaceae bacterium]